MIKLNKQGFEQEIDAFAQKANTVNGIKMRSTTDGSSLSGLDRFIQCQDQYNQIIKTLYDLLQYNAKAMNDSKDKFIQADNAIAAKVFLRG